MGDSKDAPELQEMAVGGGAAGTPASSRWNPTKEQINMLENLYKQGLRTPTADQIQEITGRLQTYGHIEGKNVFYWFQNHKARQRQKEKQDHLSLFRQYNHLHQSFFHLSPPPNVMYEPCYIPQNNLGFYVQQPQVVSPTTSSSTMKNRSSRLTERKSPDVGGFMLMHTPENAVPVAGGSTMMSKEQNESHQETLDLFPMHPTGILQEPVDTTGNGSYHASGACTSSLSGSGVDRMYFDFFC
ncbi:hypothetical protein R6Q57_028367 [Mikania cordata]